MRYGVFALIALFGVLLPAQADPVVSLLSTYHEGATRDADVPVYPWRTHIIATIFWVGEKSDSNGFHIDNLGSAWNTDWEHSYGGLDAPSNRVGYFPGRFIPHENPFYVALPFNDLMCPQQAAQCVPWWNPSAPPQLSQCRGKWIEIRTPGAPGTPAKVCYAQWEDAGPYRYDDASYVFDPHLEVAPLTTPGLDVSPAVGDLLGLSGHQEVSWRFVDSSQVPDGPWLKHEECVPALEKLSRTPSEESAIVFSRRP